MKYITILSDLDSIELKQVSDELYERILPFVTGKYGNKQFPEFQKIYDELCKDNPNPIVVALWEELNECDNLDCESIQIY